MYFVNVCECRNGLDEYVCVTRGTYREREICSAAFVIVVPWKCIGASGSGTLENCKMCAELL